MPPKKGSVILVGAGPGAADLLTLRALRALQGADVVLVDALVSPEVRALIPDRTKVLEVGKRGHGPTTSQDFINRLMVRLARGGATVVRLKGGDPSIYGRAAEERAFLESHGLRVETIAGVTAASAAAAQFGFSLTERETARRVLFATGRTLTGAQTDWRAAADSETTLCIYMGCADLAEIAASLIGAGRNSDTPAIAVLDIERPGARIVGSTLSRLSEDLLHENSGAPVLVIVGDACTAALNRSAPHKHAPQLIPQVHTESVTNAPVIAI